MPPLSAARTNPTVTVLHHIHAVTGPVLLVAIVALVIVVAAGRRSA
jgi:hypothetical protein